MIGILRVYHKKMLATKSSVKTIGTSAGRKTAGFRTNWWW
jgi:hypothetical protein